MTAAAKIDELIAGPARAPKLEGPKAWERNRPCGQCLQNERNAVAHRQRPDPVNQVFSWRTEPSEQGICERIYEGLCATCILTEFDHMIQNAAGDPERIAKLTRGKMRWRDRIDGHD